MLRKTLKRGDHAELALELIAKAERVHPGSNLAKGTQGEKDEVCWWFDCRDGTRYADGLDRSYLSFLVQNFAGTKIEGGGVVHINGSDVDDVIRLATDRLD